MSADPGLSLADLLRKSHKDELLPLCAALQVNPDGLGLGQLANILERTLRRAGGHVLVNLILRRGEGPEYTKILHDLARRLKATLPASGTVEAIELTLVLETVRKGWNRLEPDARRRAWGLLGMDGEAPTNGKKVVDVARSRLGRASGYQLATLAAGSTALRMASLVLLPVAVPFGGPLALWWLGRPRLGLLLPAVLEVAHLRQIVRHRITVGLVGSPSSGKDSALRALFGIDTGGIHPIAGSTREVTIHRLPEATALYVVNTPGLGDVMERVSEEARQVLDHIDLYLYLVNAQGGVQAREKADWDRVAATGRPALVVVNKVDTLRERDRERFLQDCRDKLGVAEDRLVGAAMDPLPQLSPFPLGVREVHAWLSTRLAELGKDPAELPVPASVSPPG